jgi:hypothetical protein
LERVSGDNVAFLVLAVPLGLAWVVLSIRYIRANHRWFTHLVESDASRPDGEQEFPARALRKFPLPRGLYFFVYAILVMLHRGPLFMFQEDARDPTTEALRRQAVARYKPLVVIVAGGVRLPA